MQTYNIGNYLKYVGLLDQHRDNIAQIVGFRPTNDIDNLSLLDLKTKTPFVADKSEVREIELNENYLKKLGFLKEEINTRIRFRKNSIVISKAFIKVHDHNSYVISEAYLGFCIEDLTNENINMKQYIEDNKFNFEKFHLDYPRAMCVNELFDYLKSINIHINGKDILLE